MTVVKLCQIAVRILGEVAKNLRQSIPSRQLLDFCLEK
jgi:hypothetical protein